jgi:hypothetical protein
MLNKGLLFLFFIILEEFYSLIIDETWSVVYRVVCPR